MENKEKIVSTFEELERLDDEVNPCRHKVLLNERAASWQENLQAQAI